MAWPNFILALTPKPTLLIITRVSLFVWHASPKYMLLQYLGPVITSDQVYTKVFNKLLLLLMWNDKSFRTWVGWSHLCEVGTSSWGQQFPPVWEVSVTHAGDVASGSRGRSQGPWSCSGQHPSSSVTPEQRGCHSAALSHKGSPRILEWIAYPFWIFPTQKSNRGLLNCRWILYQLSYQGSPWIIQAKAILLIQK